MRQIPRSLRLIDAYGQPLRRRPEDGSTSPTVPTPMVGYVRVSTNEQGRSGLGLEAQEVAIRRAAAERDWHLVAIETDTASGATPTRPGLEAALTRCRSGEAAGLVVARL